MTVSQYNRKKKLSICDGVIQVLYNFIIDDIGVFRGLERWEQETEGEINISSMIHYIYTGKLADI